ncbi:MAG: hypothetical protein ACTHON_00800, partial [Humibacter sp.]
SGVSTVRLDIIGGLGHVSSNINGAKGDGLNLLIRNFRAAPSREHAGPITLLPTLLPNEDPPVFPVIPVVDPVAGNGQVVVTETGGRTVIRATGQTQATYTIRLATAPIADVYITISVAYGPGAPYALVSLDGITYSTMVMLVIPAGDTTAHTIYLRYEPGTVIDPNEVVETVSHSSESDDPAFEHAAIANVYINMQPAQVIPNPPKPPKPPKPPVPPTPPAPPVPSGGGSSTTAAGSGLAPTGSDTAPGIALVLLTLLSGLVLLQVRRRTRRD